MKLSLLLTTALAGLSSASPLLRRQIVPSNNLTAITGVTSSLHPRRPIAELQSSSPDVFNIFVLALRSFQAEPEELDNSFYEVAGIHGVPWVPWQGQGVAGSQLGYCTHRSVLFVTWHRPYLVLFEQLLHEHALKVAATFPAADKDRWTAAAEQVRLPYWDWAADNQAGLPSMITTQTISVTTPTGAQTIANPLYAYNFKREDFLNAYFPSGWKSLRATQRSSSASTQMTNSHAARKEQTYGLYSIENFSRFSSSAFIDSDTPSSLRSVESVHDLVHSTVGGHMSQVPLAAFDPVFWLHHANVDRLAAIYQAIYNQGVLGTKATVQPLQSQMGTMGYPDGTLENENTPLWPFRNKNANLLTSVGFATGKGIWQYGYSYPEVPSSMEGSVDDQIAAFARGKVDELYAPVVATAAVASSNARVAAAAASKTRTEWQANIIFDAAEIDDTFTVWVYLGGKADSLLDSHLVSGVSSFSMSAAANADSSLIAGSVPLTAALEAADQSLDADSAVAYLKDNVSWKILSNSDSSKVISTGNLKSLEVSVAANPVKHFAQKERLAEGGEWTIYKEVTKGKEGGLSGESKYLKNVKTTEA